MTTAVPASSTTAPSIQSSAVERPGPMMASSPLVTMFRGIAIVATGDAPPWLSNLERRLSEILELGPDWNTYGADPIDLDYVYYAVQLLPALAGPDTPMPIVVPTVARGVQFEWPLEHATVEARVDEDGARIYVEDDAGVSEGILTSELASRAKKALAPPAPTA